MLSYLLGCRGNAVRYTTRRRGPNRYSCAKTSIGGTSQPPDDFDDSRPYGGFEILQELPLLVHQVGGDPRAQPLTPRRGADGHGPCVCGIRSLLDVTLLHQGGDDAAGRALVQEQAVGQSSQPERAVLHERLERVALRHRDVVTADLVSVAKLINPNELCQGKLQPLSVSLKICGHPAF
jgi:hypothetical protein